MSVKIKSNHSGFPPTNTNFVRRIKDMYMNYTAA